MKMKKGGVRKISGKSIREAAKLVLGGGVIVYPTDTVYGLGCDPMNELAARRVFAIKGRGGKPVPVLCDSLESASRLVRFSGRARQLAKDYWPGALTIVLPLRAELPELIHQGSGTLGVRVPNSRSCLELISACGGHLIGTSANRSRKPACRTAQEAIQSIGEEVDLILDGGILSEKESTVVKVSENRVEILRSGAVTVANLPQRTLSR